MNELERIALTALLEGQHPALERLRGQLPRARVRDREFNESGQFTDFWVEDDAAALDTPHRFAIDDVYGMLVGGQEEIAFLLHIVRGRLKTLEAFVIGEPWPEQPTLADTWYVAPDPQDAGQLHRIEGRDLEFALRGLTSEPEQD